MKKFEYNFSENPIHFTYLFHTVIIPAYILRNIQKMYPFTFSQTFNSIEYYFIDDCSDDNSISLVRNVLEESPNRKTLK